MDGMQVTVYWTIKEVMAFLRRSRPQIDRYRKQPGFPEAIVPSGTSTGGVLFLKHEVVDWANSRPRR
jgi:predicted DNA-binding transcriptional regulator AlpA